MGQTGTIRVGIYGGSGYAGMDLIEILKDHPCADVMFATSNTYAGENAPGTTLKYVPHEDAAMSDVEAIFLALPHGASATRAKQGLDAGLRVIDLSADMRLDDAALYQKTYGLEHPFPELLNSPYGLPEITREKLRNIESVAVPGCYPTTTLLGLFPLLARKALVKGRPIIIDAKSGVSGAGREPKPNTHFVEVFGNLSPYKVGRSHRHVVEIEQEMHKIDPNVSPIIFTPHLLPVDRGLMASIYVELDGVAADEAQALYEDCYANEPLVDVLPAGELATLKHVVRTNKCVVSLTPVLDHYLHITSVTDNLRKGAAGQAVQCFNLMYGFDETMGLL